MNNISMNMSDSQGNDKRGNQGDQQGSGTRENDATEA